MVKEIPQAETETVVSFGEKRVPRQNYSRVITLDKTLLQNCGCDTNPDSEIRAKVELIKRPDEQFIKVTPFCDEVSQMETATETEVAGDKEDE
ncbi:MAG: hypothetical protein EA442_01650 [Candidatus Nitrosopelagicus sp.]|nr:MAG: hypothetical protein EA442_01650 [Candidatus Nitrosopelagicus sp.]